VPPRAADRSAQNRRITAALLELGADALALAVRATTGHRLRGPAGARSTPGAVTQRSETVAAARAPAASTASRAPPPSTSGEDAAARIDAARERLRSRIAAPADEDPDPAPPAERQGT
jgi:hypothetical protein